MYGCSLRARPEMIRAGYDVSGAKCSADAALRLRITERKTHSEQSDHSITESLVRRNPLAFRMRNGEDIHSKSTPLGHNDEVGMQARRLSR